MLQRSLLLVELLHHHLVDWKKSRRGRIVDKWTRAIYRSWGENQKTRTAMLQSNNAICRNLELHDLYHCQLMKNFTGWPVKYSSTVLSSQRESVSQYKQEKTVTFSVVFHFNVFHSSFLLVCTRGKIKTRIMELIPKNFIVN